MLSRKVYWRIDICQKLELSNTSQKSSREEVSDESMLSPRLHYPILASTTLAAMPAKVASNAPASVQRVLETLAVRK